MILETRSILYVHVVKKPIIPCVQYIPLVEENSRMTYVLLIYQKEIILKISFSVLIYADLSILITIQI